MIILNFNEGTNQELYLRVKCLVTNATNYDVFIGQEALFPPSFIIDNWFKHAYSEMDWETNGHHLGYIPLDLHGNHSPMAHHCMLKEAHTISYIQQVSHEWIKGDEEETTHTQATKSLRVVPMDIQHILEVLQRLLSQLITWTPPNEGITLLELFGGIGTGVETLL